MIHYCLEKDMAKMDRNIKLRKHHKVKRTAIFPSSHTFFLSTLWFYIQNVNANVTVFLYFGILKKKFV